MPDTLYRLLPPLGYGWADGRERPAEAGERNLSANCRFKAGSDCWPIDGGVEDPEVGVVPLLASLDVSVDRSVRKLCLDRLRSSLKLKRDGAMAGARDAKMGSLQISIPIPVLQLQFQLPRVEEANECDAAAQKKKKKKKNQLRIGEWEISHSCPGSRSGIRENRKRTGCQRSMDGSWRR